MTPNTHPTPVVTLNSFQGPSLRRHRSAVAKRGLTAPRATLPSAHAARWMLKQVQHDALEFIVVPAKAGTAGRLGAASLQNLQRSRIKSGTTNGVHHA